MKKLISILLLTLALILMLGLSSCSLLEPLLGGSKDEEEEVQTPPDVEEEEKEEEKPPVVNLAGITLPSKTLVYDGAAHSTEIVGEISDPDLTVKYEGNGVTDAGTYTVVAKFYYKNEYLTGKDLTATITISRAKLDSYGIYFAGSTVVYNGQPQSIALSGSIPAAITPIYEGNGKSEIGEYTVTAKLTVDEKNYEPLPDMQATLKIVDGPAAFAGARLDGITLPYDAKAHSLAVSGVDSSVSASYSDSARVNAGKYEITATLTKGGESLALSSTLTIEPRRLDVSAADATFIYTGSKRSIQLVWGEADKLDGIDKLEGIIVESVGNGTAAIGSHSVSFRFSLSEAMRGNILYQPDITATLTINPNPNSKTTGLVYSSNSSGDFIVSGYTGVSSVVIIPEKYTNTYGVEGRVVGIAPGAFEGNVSIEYVYIPSSIKSIGNRAFAGCVALKSVTLSEGISSIGALAFESTALTDITIPESISAIGQSAFRGTNPERIKLPFIGGSRNTSNPYIGYIFGASAYGGNAQMLPESLKTVILSDTCTIIPAYSFYGASSIEEVVIGKGVREIGVSAFAGCSSLIGLYVPSSVTDIPAAANNYNSPIWGCKDGFILATDAVSANTGWAIKHDILDDAHRAEKVFSVDYAGFLEAVRGYLFAKK